MIIKCLLSAPILFAFTSVNAMQYQVVELQQQRFDVIQVQQLNQLELFLKNPQTNQYYQKFSHIEKITISLGLYQMKKTDTFIEDIIDPTLSS